MFPTSILPFSGMWANVMTMDGLTYTDAQGNSVTPSVGDEVPADAVLLESTELVVSEYILNGKYECLKTTLRKECDLGQVDQSNYVMFGSIVLQGEAVAQVFAVGNHVANNEEQL